MIQRFLSWLDQRSREKEFFTQEFLVSNSGSRLLFFKNRVSGKSVLHVGCTDFPIGGGSLHCALQPYCTLTGFDSDFYGLQTLKKFSPGSYSESWDELRDKRFDLVIVPEVLEHQRNAGIFLSEVFSLRSNEWIITAPNFYPQWQRTTRPAYHFGVFREIVHPDHVAWYSPHTLFSICEPWLMGKSWELYFLEKRSMIAICIENRK